MTPRQRVWMWKASNKQSGAKLPNAGEMPTSPHCLDRWPDGLTRREVTLMPPPSDRVLPSREAVRHSDNIHDFPTYLERVLLPLAQAWRSGRLVDREALNASAAVEAIRGRAGYTPEVIVTLVLDAALPRVDV